MNVPTQQAVDSPKRVVRRRVAWICLLTALAHVIATLLSVYAIREGNLGDFSPLRLMQFVPQHVILWRCAWLCAALASLSFVLFALAICHLIDRRLRPALAFALILVTVAVSNDLSGQLSMLVLFSDLAYQFRAHGSFLQHETAQLAWTTMSQALTESVLVANTLYSIAGLVIVVCALLTRSFPRWLAWAGLPVWVATLSVSVLSFLGALKWALVLLLASTVAFAIWAMVMGLSWMFEKPAELT